MQHDQTKDQGDTGYQLDKDKRRKQDESGQQDTTTDLQEDLREDQMI